MSLLAHVPEQDQRERDQAGRDQPVDLARLFRAADDGPRWSDRPVSRDTLAELHALMSLGPALLDASPARALFLTSERAKARLSPCLLEARRDAVLSAPVSVVIGYDLGFAEQLAAFLPDTGREMEEPGVARRVAARNGALQGAYLIVAARALGLEAGPEVTFDAAAVSREFFGADRIRTTFVGGLGYGAGAAA